MQKEVSEFTNALKSGNVGHYQKIGTTYARLAVEGEKIDTIINGKLEITTNAKQGDYVVKGPEGEIYPVKPEVFESRYVLLDKKQPPTTDRFVKFKPTGKVYACKYTGEESFYIKHSRGDMLVEKGDWICNLDLKSKEFYRIERRVFPKTYKLIKMV